jgi:hypothetical protein
MGAMLPPLGMLLALLHLALLLRALLLGVWPVLVSLTRLLRLVPVLVQMLLCGLSLIMPRLLLIPLSRRMLLLLSWL